VRWLETQQLAFRLTQLWRDGTGRAAACNAGLAAASGAVVVFLDDDMEPASTWLAAHLAAHAGPEPVAVVGSVPSARPLPSSPAGRYLARRFDRHLAKLATAVDLTFRDVYTGNASIPRTALIGVGGYDESFAAYGNEDGDLAIRLDEAGVPWRFDADALAWQHQDKDLAAAFADARAKGRTAVLLASRHPTRASLLRLGRPGSLPRRTIRNLLLGMTRLAPVTQTAILRAVGLLERVGPPGLDRLYDVVFDYGYWLGVRSARSSDSPVPGLP
jgi:GT2 family glycosyltransferase